MEDQHQETNENGTVESTSPAAVVATNKAVLPPGQAEHVDDTPQYIIVTEHQPADRHSPNFRFSWRLTPEGLAELQRRQARFPYLIAVIVKEWESSTGMKHFREERRLFCRLQDGEGLIQFERSGERTILFGAVFFGDSIDEQRQADRMMKDQDDEWPRIARAFDERLALRDPDERFLPGTERIEINIDASLFAKRPSEWLAWWVNLWRERPAQNTCEFKKQCWVAFLPQPVCVGLFILLRSVVVLAWLLILFLFGWRWRYLSLSTIAHPFDGDLSDDVWKRMEWPEGWEHDSRGFSCRRTPEGENKSFALFWQMPLTFVAAAFGGSYVYLRYIRHDAAISEMLIACAVFSFFALGCIFALALVSVGIRVISFGLDLMRRLFQRRQEAWRIERPEKPKKPRKPAWENSAELLTTLVEDRTATPAAPKPHPRPVLRRWLDAKGRLCLPYAR